MVDPPGETVIRTSGVRKTYRATTALDGVDLHVTRGEVFALLGPNGAGKTTAIEICEGYRGRDAGEVHVLGHDPGKPSRAWRCRIGLMLQSTDDLPELGVAEIIRHFARYYPRPREPEAVIEQVGLTDKADVRVRKLSGGQRRRLEVALSIVGDPELLFLDEPTTGFDPEARRQFWGLIRRLTEDGKTIVLTTHYLAEAEELADRVGVIANGRILETATPATLGDRANATPTVSWTENGSTRERATDSPTALVTDLAGRFDDEIPDLRITRPTLEDIYLDMVGAGVGDG